MDALLVRAQAARELVGKGLLDGELALAYVIFPTEAVEAASAAVAVEDERPRSSASAQVRALELVDAGWSWSEAGREVGVPKSTVGAWIRKRRVAAGLRTNAPVISEQG